MTSHDSPSLVEKTLYELREENKELHQRLNKRNRHIVSLKAIIQDLKAQTKIIFEERGDDE